MSLITVLYRVGEAFAKEMYMEKEKAYALKTK